MIKVNISGIFMPALEGGADGSHLAPFYQELRTSHRELMARRGRDIGFYDLPFDDELTRGVLEEAKRLRSIADDLIVCGIGGSSLGGQALTAALAKRGASIGRVHFVDNVDPDTMMRILDSLEPMRTAALIVTKSGATVETLAQLLIVRRWFRVSLGQGELRKRMTFITDPDKGLLRDLANKEGIRSFDIPSNVGGRFSVLTGVGLLPAAFAEIDIKEVLLGAKDMVSRITDDSIQENPALNLAAGCLFALRKYNATSLVMMPYCDALRTATGWFVQLWAESLGKRMNRNGEVIRAGQTPIPAVGATDQHSQMQLFIEGPRDKVVVLVSLEKFGRTLLIPDELEGHEEVSFLHGHDLAELMDAERRGSRAALLNAGVPVIDIRLPAITPRILGGFFVLLEGACALTGTALGINPFNQPGVEAGKKMALGLMGRQGFSLHAEQVKARELLDRLP